MKKVIAATLATGCWINLSEFLRNELLFKQLWLDKYSLLGLEFPSTAVNNALWVLWGFVFSGCIAALSRRCSFWETAVLSWVMGFAMMWMVIGNLNVLPTGLLPVAVPWSVVEVAAAVLITHRVIHSRPTRQR